MFSDYKADYEVCNCAHVSLSQITTFIKDKNITRLGLVQEYLKVGTGCMNCICEDADDGKIKKKIYCMDILKGINSVEKN